MILNISSINAKGQEVQLQEPEVIETEYQFIEPLQSRSIGLRASSILQGSSWKFTKDECNLVYRFLKSTSGSVTITLQKENSNGTWTDVASKYHSFSFTTSTIADVPVSNLSAGTYQVKTAIYAIIAGTEYYETQYTGTRRLY